MMIRGGNVRPLDQRRPDVPERLTAAVHRALSMDPAERFDSAREMSWELEDVLRADGPPIDENTLVSRAVAQTLEARRSSRRG